MRRILFTGGSGLLAVNWILKIRYYFDVYVVLHERVIIIKGTKNLFVELTNKTKIKNIFNDIQPDLVINTIALTNVDYCDQNPKLAEKINKQIPINIAEICSLFSIKLVHISTDHLFNGEKSMVNEESYYNPVNVYGKTKAEAEVGIQKHCPDSLIIRTNFFGWGLPYRQSFSDYIISSLRNGTRIEMFDDVFFTPILIDDLVSITHQLLDLNQAGIFNTVCSDRISKYDFSKVLCDYFDLDQRLINKSFAEKNNISVKRPLDLSLSNKKLCNTLGINNFSLNDCIHKMLEQERKGLSKKKFTFKKDVYSFI